MTETSSPGRRSRRSHRPHGECLAHVSLAGHYVSVGAQYAGRRVLLPVADICPTLSAKAR
jgi:hypothetical protein